MTFFFGSPEEIEQRVRAHAEHVHMHHEDFQHQMESVWLKLDADECRALASWLMSLGSAPAPQAALSYQAGSLFRLAAQKQNVCLVCDKNHDKEAEALLAEQPDPMEQGDKVAFVVSSSKEAQSGPTPDEIVAAHEAKVTEYRLVQNFDKGGFNCTGCGQWYNSLEDRMLQPPGIEGCPGCRWKGAHG